MKKNFKNVGLILGMIAMTSFTMTSCAEAEAAADDAKTEAEGKVEEKVEEVKEEVIETVTTEEVKCGAEMDGKCGAEGATEVVEGAVETTTEAIKEVEAH